LHTAAGVRRPLQTASTDCAFSLALNVLLGRFTAVFSCVVVIFKSPYEFLFITLNLHRQRYAFCADYNALLSPPPHHVTLVPRLAAQRQFLDVRLDSFLDRFLYFLPDSEEPVRRAQPVDTLVGALVVVEFHPVRDPLLRRFE
jgi:hypothetical protein